jgi:cytochrome c-type biogenesis protein CcmE
MKARNKRLMFFLAGGVLLGVATTFIFVALGKNINVFYSPAEVKANQAPRDRTFRLGGLVKEGSLQRQEDGLTVNFLVTDNAETIQVTYKGILPDLFKEGQGVIAQGRLNESGGFTATEVLAKHDETYMPPEVASALEKNKPVAESAATTPPANPVAN